MLSGSPSVVIRLWVEPHSPGLEGCLFGIIQALCLYLDAVFVLVAQRVLERFGEYVGFFPVVGMHDTSMLSFCTVSYRKWYRTPIHLRLRVAPLFFAICTADVLSMCSTGWRVVMLVSRIMLASQIFGVAVSAAAMCSASQVLLATMGCFPASHCTGAPLSIVTVPATDFCVESSLA